MRIFLSGSLAYDRIMEYSGSFSDSLLADKINDINVCFMVNGMKENYGGTAGNIAYSLKMLGGEPEITATIGLDNQRYLAWLTTNKIITEGIRCIETEWTAGAYITTDKNNNQITNFNPGAMNHSSEFDFSTMSADDIMVVSPGSISDMVTYPKICREKGFNYIFDPGQSLPALQADDILACIDGCMLLMVNDYEMNLICQKTTLSQGAILERAGKAIVTQGEKGSLLFENAQRTTIPVIQATEVLDPTGAGDAYRAGLLFGLSKGKNLEESAIIGSAVASFSVASYGTQEFSFTPEEIKTRIETLS